MRKETTERRKIVEQLVNENRRVAQRIAHYMAMKSGHPEMEKEFEQAGMIGLWQAAERYDEDAEGAAPFPAYAARRVQGEMLDLLRDDYEYLGRKVRRETTEIERAKRRLEHQLGRAPRASEVADCLQIALEEYYRRVLAEYAPREFSMDEVSSERMNRSTVQGTEDDRQPADLFVHDKTTPLDMLLEQEQAAALERARSALSKTELAVLDRRMEGRQLAEIGREMGFGASRACQIMTSAVLKVKRRMSHEGMC